MQIFELKGEVRTDLGKKATKALRVAGKVPCVLYGNGAENVHFAVEERALQNLLYTPIVYIVKLNISGKEYEAVMREIQFHPVSDRVLHIDFFQIVALAYFKVIRVVSRRNLYSSGSEFLIHIIIRYNRNFPACQRQDYIFPYNIFVSLIIRMHRNRRISQHGFRTCRGNLKEPVCSHERDVLHFGHQLIILDPL